MTLILTETERNDHVRGTVVYRRKLNLEANLEGASSCARFKRLDPSTFNVGLIGSSFTAVP
jgi:hypothetical protein